ncbi:SpoIIE family protein phosphatase [bacterium]|nr:SpoIIE family protein phosphatase [bacterium]
MDKSQTAASKSFRIRFPVSTKMLVSVVVLLLVVIGFINISAILLIQEDKQFYTYQSQSNEANLVGQNFINSAKYSFDTLRLSLANVNPASPPPAAKAESLLKAVVNNQSDLILVSVGRINVATKDWAPTTTVLREAEAKKLNVPATATKLTPEQLEVVMTALQKEGYAFLNLAGASLETPLLAIFYAEAGAAKPVDPTNPVAAPPISVAMGVISLKAMVEELRGMNVSVTDLNGWILFDTDPAVVFGGGSLARDPLFRKAYGSKVSSGTFDYRIDEQRYLGTYVRPGLNLVVLSRVEWTKAMRATYFMMERFMVLGGMAIGMGILFAVLFSKNLTAPIARLYGATQEVGKGNFDLDLGVQSKDEIGALTNSFNMMSKKISELFQESALRIRLENEINIASTVQQTLIPPEVFSNENIYIRSYYKSASQCGGDWWGFFGVGKKLCIMISDATGHGLPSALITASARSCFSCMHKLAAEDPDFSFSPSAMLSYANRVVFDASLGKINMTFFVGVIDFEYGTLTYANAGHNPPWLFRKDGDGTVIQSLMALGTRLGENRSGAEFEEKTVTLKENDTLFLYTDGLMEGRDSSGVMYGKKRTRSVVESAIESGPQNVVNTLMQDFMNHNGEKELDDDITLAVARILKIGAAELPPQKEEEPVVEEERTNPGISTDEAA